MKVFAESLDEYVDDFLHAGYTSAYPRTFEMGAEHSFMEEDVQFTTYDVGESLALASPESAPASPSAEVVQPAASPLQPGRVALQDLLPFGMVVVFFLILAGLYQLKVRKGTSNRKLLLCLAAPFCTILALICLIEPAAQAAVRNNLKAPWEGVAVQQYKDPKAATETILYGLIDPALSSCDFKPRTLAALQGDVVWPLKSKDQTPGMKYAASTYGRDGWGREFRLQRNEKYYVVTSAGPDGVFDNTDDLVHKVLLKAKYGWEGKIRSLYVRHADKKSLLIVRKQSDRLFESSDARTARQLTGTNHFDALTRRPVLQQKEARERPSPLKTAIRKHYSDQSVSARKQSILLVHRQLTKYEKM